MKMRVAVVTGASSGTGREFVRQLEYFYKDLDEIWVIARREERLEQLRKEVNVPLRITAKEGCGQNAAALAMFIIRLPIFI